MARDDDQRLAGIRCAAAEISLYTAAVDFEMFVEDLKTRDAVLMALVAIGEASSRLTSETKLEYPGVNWSAAVGLRNQIAHGYFEIQWDVVWLTAVEDIPNMLQAIEQREI